MKKILSICIVLMLVMAVIFVGCGQKTVETAETVKTPQPGFGYILVDEAGTYYLHKLDSWSTNNGIVTFKCSVCGNTIRLPEAKVTMYDKVSLETAWSDYVDVCSGDASDWHDLLGN